MLTIFNKASFVWQEDADLISELMIAAMKVPENRLGIWVWRIKDNLHELVGENYCFDDCEEED